MPETQVIEKPEVKDPLAQQPDTEKEPVVDTKPVKKDEGTAALDRENMEAVLKRVHQNPALLKDPEIKGVIDTLEKLKQNGQVTDKKVEKTDEKLVTEANGKKPETVVATDAPADATEKPEGKSDEETSAFLAAKPEPVEIKDIENLNSHIEKKYAIKDVPTFFNSVDQWRTDATKLIEVKEAHESLTNTMAQLPKPLFEAVESWMVGGDWEQAISKSGGRFNLALPFDDQSKDKILKNFYPDELSKMEDKLKKEEITQEEFDDRADLLHGTARKQYATEQSHFEDERTKILDKQEKFQTNFDESVTGSVEYLKTKVPGLSDPAERSKVDAVKDLLVKNKVINLLYTPDGFLKKEAGYLAYLLKYGDGEIEKLVKMAENRGASKAAEMKADGLAKKPDATKQGTVLSADAQVQKDALNSRLLGSKLVENDPLAHIPKDD